MGPGRGGSDPGSSCRVQRPLCEELNSPRGAGPGSAEQARDVVSVCPLTEPSGRTRALPGTILSSALLGNTPGWAGQGRRGCCLCSHCLLAYSYR